MLASLQPCTPTRDLNSGSLELPPELAVGAEYELAVLRTGNAQAALPFVLYILSAWGQAIPFRERLGPTPWCRR